VLSSSQSAVPQPLSLSRQLKPHYCYYYKHYYCNCYHTGTARDETAITANEERDFFAPLTAECARNGCRGAGCAAKIRRARELTTKSRRDGHKALQEIYRLYAKARSNGTVSLHMQPDSITHNFAVVPRDLLPIYSHTWAWSPNRWPFFDIDDMRRLRTYKHVRNNRNKSSGGNCRDNWRVLLGQMDKYCKSGKGTLVQALFWATTNHSTDGRADHWLTLPDKQSGKPKRVLKKAKTSATIDEATVADSSVIVKEEAVAEGEMNVNSGDMQIG
jgi:hypothetical protein